MHFPEQQATGIAIGENFADLLSRVDKIPLEKKVEISDKYNCSHEFAGIIYILENDLGIDSNLIISDLEYELQRREQHDSSVPKVESYLYNFAVSEGKWIAYTRGTLRNNIIDEIKSLHLLYSKLGKVTGVDLITLATQIMMERQFIAANKIIPIINKWVEEHPNSSESDAAIFILASLVNEPISETLVHLIEENQEDLVKQVEVLGEILANADQTNWIIRALIEAEILYEDLGQPISEMSSKGLSDLIVWIMTQSFSKKIGDFTTKEDIGKLIMRFQLESALGLSSATPQLKLEYNLLTLNYKDDLAKNKLAEDIITEAWKEARLGDQPLEIGREILAMLLDYSNLPHEFISKIPRHFEYIVTYFNADKLRLNRALTRIKTKGKEPTDGEKQEAVILDYLIQYVINYIVGKMKADPAFLEVPDELMELELGEEEKEIIDMIDAAIKRGIRTRDKFKAQKILEDQVMFMYNRLLNILKNEVAVGETVLYGVFNMYDIDITRGEAKERILDHMNRMKILPDSPYKKRVDSSIQKAICIEIEERILKRDLK
ncbi:MAG: hypothetical protein FK734_05770 [Asgard group archaeon]|nr:hypothetical protein [Asgard group archaeon]